MLGKPTGLDKDVKRDVEGTAGVDGTGAGQTGVATKATLTRQEATHAGREILAAK